MSDNKNGPLNDRGKGLEDEWIRRKEAEEAAEKKAADAAKKAGEKPANKTPKIDQPQPRKTSSPVSLVLFIIVIAAIVAAFAFLG